MNTPQRIRLHWFSPLPPSKTGIADYTAGLVPYLQEQAEVVLWTTQDHWDSDVERYAPVRRFRHGELKWTDIANCAEATNIPIFHLGNNGEFHQEIWELSCAIPGITVLHDTRLQHFFGHVLRDRLKARERYVRAMQRHYGEEGARAAERFWVGGHSTEEMAHRFPLALLALENSPAAVVHSEESLKLLAEEGYHTATCLPLPYASRQERPARVSGPPFRIAIFGYLGPNRRLDAFFKALAGFPDRKQFRVDVFGTVSDPLYIRGIVQQGGIEEIVDFRGHLPLDQLEAGLSAAHLAVNLRFPTMGEASLSQLQLWDHGLATMVTPVGWYAHLPEGTVVYVRPEHETADIQRHLKDFLMQPDHFFRMGWKAREFLKKMHQPQKYAADFLEFAAEYRSFVLRRTALELAERAARNLRGWLPPHCVDIISPSISDRIASLMCVEERRRHAAA